MDEARGHLCGVFAEHGINYLPRERHLEFRHRQAKLGPIALNSLQWGAGVMVSAPLLPDFYLLQFTLTGVCELWQETHHSVLPARSVTIVNPGRAFRKAWMPRTRQLLLRIDRRLVERELRAWTGGNEGGSVEFDVPPIEDLATVGTLALFVRMICDDLKNEASDLSHPLVADRVASGLVALLLTSMPHNKQRAIETVNQPTAPFFVRRVEEFIEEHARDPITLADLTGIAGVSTRALQPLGDMAARLRVAVVSITHFSKGAGQSAVNSFIGSIAFVAAARAAFIVTRDPDSTDNTRRLFVQAKNNLGPDSGGLAFRLEQHLLGGDIVASAIAWEGERIDRTADEIMAANRECNEKPERSEAEEFLRDILSGGPCLATEIKSQATAACLAWRTVNRAKRDLGIVSTPKAELSQEPGKPPRVQWWWSLPIEQESPRMPPTSQDCHVKDVASLENVGILGGAEGDQ